MGWTIHIVTARPIAMSDAEDIIATMGPTLAGERGGNRQKWGWCCAVDVHNPEGNDWYISGAYFSAPAALVMERFLVNALEERGYSPEVTYRSAELLTLGETKTREAMIWINLRDSAAVTLTPQGRAVWDLIYPENPQAVGGTLQIPLYELMKTFGPFLDRVDPFVEGSLCVVKRLVK